jgi:uncharacterized protein involved in response to NO
MASKADKAPPVRSPIAAGSTFYLAASLYAAIVLPWSVLAMMGIVSGPPSLATPLGHAHEMLLGYALAVVAGNQLGALSPARRWALLAAWLAARLAFIAFGGIVAAAFDIAFVAALGVHATPRLFRAAKKLRNQALPVIISALCAAAVAFDVAAFALGDASAHEIALGVVLALAALMLFMGGRIIAPAAAGQFYRQGAALDARVQPRIEGTILVAMALAVGSAPFAPLVAATQIACAVAGALAVVRLLRWRLWACKGRPDLWCLGAGYLWLGAGLLGIALAAQGALRTAAMHLVTVGALGTLTFNVMTITMLTRAHRPGADEARLVWGTLLIALATIARFAAALAPDRAVELFVAAAACWSVAFLVAAWILIDAVRGHARWLREKAARGAA